MIVGIDVGGTFTDLVLLEEHGGLVLGKLPSTPADQAVGIMAGLRGLVREPRRLLRIAHGTTVSTNALLQGTGGPVGLVTTAGFRDVLEIGRTRRMLPSLYDPEFVRPAPMVPRPLRCEVPERLAADGTALIPLDGGAVRRAAAELAGRVRAIAVCFLHSWNNDAHERRAEQVLRAAMPDVHLTISADVIREFREYERFSTTVINAFLLPVMDTYLVSLDAALHREGSAGKLMTMSSGGGVLDTATVRRLPVRTVLSGPAGGVAGALWVARSAGIGQFITCDMGGTSTDVCVIEDGRPAVVSETAFAGFPMKGLQYDINTVGAGGGSVAHTGADAILRVGPLSAGAEPGPACYGRGGSEPTVTDANVLLGRLGTARRLGGSVRLDAARAAGAVGTLARRLGMAPHAVAEGILQVAAARMAGAIRAITVERGRDPADFALLPFGGAGPMHAGDLAEELGIREIIVPVCPGNLSALGLLASDLRQELVRTWVRPLAQVDGADLARLVAAHEAAGRALPLLAGLPAERIRFEHTLEMRYARQAFEIPIALPARMTDPAAIGALFLDTYRQHYGHADTRSGIEIVSLRSIAVGVTDKPAPRALARSTGASPPMEMRAVHLRGTVSPWPVYPRAAFAAGERFAGPAIVEEDNATTIVLPGWNGIVDDWGNLRLTRE